MSDSLWSLISSIRQRFAMVRLVVWCCNVSLETLGGYAGRRFIAMEYLATSLSLFIGNNRTRKPLIAPNSFMT